MNVLETSYVIGANKGQIIKESQSINLFDLIKSFTQFKTILLHSMIKQHNLFNKDDGKDDFIFTIRNGEVLNKKEIEEANQYIKNSNRSYYFEGIKQYNNSNLFYITWSS
jgi:hypothetical protein